MSFKTYLKMNEAESDDSANDVDPKEIAVKIEKPADLHKIYTDLTSDATIKMVKDAGGEEAEDVLKNIANDIYNLHGDVCSEDCEELDKPD